MELVAFFVICAMLALLTLMYFNNRRLEAKVEEVRGAYHAEQTWGAESNSHRIELEQQVRLLEKTEAALRKQLEESLARHDKLVDVVVSFKKDGYTQRPPMAAPPVRENTVEAMPADVNEALGKYPAEFRSGTLQWIKDRRIQGVEWSTILAHMTGGGSRGGPTG